METKPEVRNSRDLDPHLSGAWLVVLLPATLVLLSFEYQLSFSVRYSIPIEFIEIGATAPYVIILASAVVVSFVFGFVDFLTSTLRAHRLGFRSFRLGIVGASIVGFILFFKFGLQFRWFYSVMNGICIAGYLGFFLKKEDTEVFQILDRLIDPKTWTIRSFVGRVMAFSLFTVFVAGVSSQMITSYYLIRTDQGNFAVLRMFGDHAIAVPYDRVACGQYEPAVASANGLIALRSPLKLVPLNGASLTKAGLGSTVPATAYSRCSVTRPFEDEDLIGPIQPKPMISKDYLSVN